MTEETEYKGKSVAVGGLCVAFALVVLLGCFARVGMPLPISALMLIVMLVRANPAVGLPVLVALVLLAYYGWIRPILVGHAQFTIRTWVVLATLALLSGSWYYEGWAFGLKWQGTSYTLGCAIMSIILLTITTGLGLLGRVWNRSRVALWARWIAVVWIISYGFPWLGEFP
jgi:hypothetical protein